jgi:hypothetical protein
MHRIVNPMRQAMRQALQRVRKYFRTLNTVRQGGIILNAAWQRVMYDDAMAV